MTVQPLRYYCLLVLLLLTKVFYAQQTIQVIADKNAITLGEPINLSIKIVGDQPYKAVIPGSLGRFEVLERKPLQNSTDNGFTTSTQQITITSFDSGQLQIPPVAIEGNPGVVSTAINVLVKKLPADSIKVYGDLKQIINLQPPEQWPYLMGLLFVMLLSAYMIYRLNRKHEWVQSPVWFTPQTESPGMLIEQLEQLHQQWLQQQTAPVMLGNKLMEIFRKFLAAKGMNITSKTGEEMIITTNGQFETETWLGIAQTVRLCNALRFGKYQAPIPEGVQAIESFKKAITYAPLTPIP